MNYEDHHMGQQQTKSINDKRLEFTEAVNKCHKLSKENGWWVGRDKSDVPKLLMLCVSELAEAMEGHRKNKMDDHLPDRSSLEVELADAVIRICDMAGGFDLDLEGAINDKLEYNTKRLDHKLSNREKNDGKKY